MKPSIRREPLLTQLYRDYLESQDAASFIQRVAIRYGCATLERLATSGDRYDRRASVLALGYMGEYSSNDVMGRALTDRDRGVRAIAETSIQEVWRRVGSRDQRCALRQIVRLNIAKQHEQAIETATGLIHESPWIAEAWAQRGAAYYHQGQFEAAIRDCHQGLEINPYHFTAAAGMGQCYLRIDNPMAALEAFRRALRLNPGMEEVRAQVIQLQRSIRDE